MSRKANILEFSSAAKALPVGGNNLALALGGRDLQLPALARNSLPCQAGEAMPCDASFPCNEAFPGEEALPGCQPAPRWYAPTARALDPKRPILSGWVGGKMRLARQILELIPAHRIYAEPFAGAAWILFKKPLSPVEILNDINNEVVNLYQMIQHKPDELAQCFQFALKSRHEFERLKALDPADLSDIERAWRFYYLFALGFGGKVAQPNFCIRDKGSWGKYDFSRVRERLLLAHERLRNVTFECLDFATFIRRYDCANAFFYLDPPYLGVERYYGAKCFNAKRLAELAGILEGIKGKFLLTINDLPRCRDLFANFHLRQVGVSYSLNDRQRTPRHELFISNYQLPSLL